MLPSAGDYMERNFGFGRIVGMMLADIAGKALNQGFLSF